MLERVARLLRELSSTTTELAGEFAPPSETELDPALEPEEIRRGVEQLRAIELEGLLARALNPFTRQRPYRA